MPQRLSVGWTLGPVVAVALLGGCASAPSTTTSATTSSTAGPVVTSPDAPSRTTGAPGTSATSVTSVTTTGSGCAGRSTSPGPAGSLVVVGFSAPATAAVGSTITVSAQLVVLSSGPRIVLTAQGSAVEILRGSTVVGRAAGPGDADVPLPLTAGASYPGQTLPTHVPLVGCDGTPLPAGAYRLRAVVAYGGDPLNAAPGGSGAGSFVLVGDPPLDLTVT